MSQTNVTLYKGVDALFKSVLNGAELHTPEIREFISRAIASEKEKKIINSLLKQNRKLINNAITFHQTPQDLKDWYATADENLKETLLIHTTMGAVFDLVVKLDKWLMALLQCPPVTVTGRREAISRLTKNATALLDDFHRLGLPVDAYHYLTDEETIKQHKSFIKMLFPPEQKVDTYWLDKENDLKDFLTRNTEGGFEDAVIRVDKVLERLMDRKWINNLAQPPMTSKTNTKSWRQVVLIRKLASYFIHKYGTPLQNTIANICSLVLVFDGKEIDRANVRSALVGYKFDAAPDWNTDGLSARVRADFVGG